jgi:hypothetical protein
MVCFAHERYEEGRRWAERSLETAEAIGNIAAVHRGHSLVLAARVALGETGGLVGLPDAVEEDLGKGGTALLYVYVVVEALLGIGEIKRAERVARGAVTMAAGRFRELLAGLALGEVLVRLGPAHWAEAERTIDREVALAEALGARSCRGFGQLARGRLAVARRQREVANAAWGEARALFAELGMTRYARIAGALLAANSADTEIPFAPASVAPEAATSA